MSDKLDTEELSAYFALVVAGDLVQHALSSQLAEHGLTPVKFSILASLSDAPDGVRMRELASALVHSRSGLTYQVAQLERQGLVSRSAADDDDRGVVARITADGTTLLQAAFPGHLELVRAKFLDLLPRGGAEKLRRLLEPVVDGLRADKAT